MMAAWVADHSVSTVVTGARDCNFNGITLVTEGASVTDVMNAEGVSRAHMTLAHYDHAATR